MNLVSQDVNDVTDRTEATLSDFKYLPPARRSGTDMLNRERSPGAPKPLASVWGLAANALRMDGADEATIKVISD